VFTREAKLSDLGRASRKGQSGPHDHMAMAGDPYYAPPELLYRSVDGDWSRRRVACDAYLLGSLIHFFFTSVGFTQALLARLHPTQRPNEWSGTFEAALPHIRQAFNETLRTFRAALAQRMPAPLADELTLMVEQLCEPENTLRGHPRNRRFVDTQFSLERYISRLDALARKAALQRAS